METLKRLKLQSPDCPPKKIRDDATVRRLSIGIVGCGVGGCTASLLLARQGHRVTLFEQTPRVGPIGAGVLLQVSGQRVLQSLGLLDAVIAGAERIEELIAFTHRGRLLSQLRFADAPGGHVAYGIHRGDLFAVLHSAVIAAGIDLRLNHTITGLDSTGSTLTSSNGNESQTFDLVIAADGSRSRLRDASGIQAIVHSYGPAALWAVGNECSIRGRLLQHARHTRQLCGLLPMGGGRTSLFWGIDSADWPRLQRLPFPKWQREVLQLLPAAEPLVREMSSFDDLCFSTYRAVWMPRVFKGSTVFIGDAAHACSPLLGHGINLAMVDARDLAHAIADESDVPTALRRFNAAQRRRNNYYSFLSGLLSPSFQGSSTLIGIARDFTLPQLQRISPLRRIMLRTLTGV